LVFCFINVAESLVFSSVPLNIWEYCLQIHGDGRLSANHPQAMLTEIYIEALLVDEELADQVWEAWDAGSVTDAHAELMWRLIVVGISLKLIRGAES
jgi:hypothetical protein